MMPDSIDPDTGEVLEEDGMPPSPQALTLDAARALILARHDHGICDDDPVLMLVTLHEGFMADYERMLERHNEAITSVISSAIKGLTEQALADHLENQVRLADRTEEIFKRQYRRAWLLSAISLLCALICIPIAIHLIIN